MTKPPHSLSSGERQEIREAFAARLDYLRLELNESIYEFSGRCGVKDAAMRNYLAARSLPSFESLIGISRATGVSLDFLIGGQHSLEPINERTLAHVIEIALGEILRPAIRSRAHVHELVHKLSELVVILYRIGTTAGPKGIIAIDQLRDRAANLEDLLTRYAARHLDDSSEQENR